MNIATVLRYVQLSGDNIWTQRYYIMHDYMLMANKYKFGLQAIMTEYDIDRVCKNCDGLIITGSGTNIDPKYYGMPGTIEPPVVDEYALDSKLMEYFHERKKPIFGVCGGHQAINIFFGGTIKKLDDPQSHSHKAVIGSNTIEEPAHIVDITEGSFVHDVFGKKEYLVNSHHGWEIGRLASDLEAVAVTRDGVIEAVENREKKIFATQWHPEQSFHRGDATEHKFFENFLRLCEESR